MTLPCFCSQVLKTTKLYPERTEISQLFSISYKFYHRGLPKYSQKEEGSQTETESQPTTRRGFKPVYILYIFGGLLIVKIVMVTFSHYVYGGERQRRSLEEMDPIAEVQAHYDPDLGKNVKMIKYKGYLLPSFVKSCLRDIKNFHVRNDDMFVVSFPKSGNYYGVLGLILNM